MLSLRFAYRALPRSVLRSSSTKSRYSDKTGITAELKSIYAGSFYNSYRFTKDGLNYDYNYKHGALRAMNSMVWSGGYASGFVYRNAGLAKSNGYC